MSTASKPTEPLASADTDPRSSARRTDRRNAQSGYVPALDGIRGVAIVWVIFHNVTDMPFAPTHGVLRLLNVFAHSGWIGVQLFFALSGFLITAGLLATQSAPHYFRAFYAKRALRILPLYYGVLFVLLVLAPRLAGEHWPFNASGQASLWLFTVNWTHTAPYGFAHFWSLAVEEQFYLVWPLLVWRLPPRRLLSVCLWICLGALLLRGAMVLGGVDSWTIYSATTSRMDALALGAAGACALRISSLRGWIELRANALAPAALLLFVAGFPLTRFYSRYDWSGETLGYTLLAVVAAGLVIAGTQRTTVARALAWAPLRSIGKYSYAMYVFQGLLHKLIGESWLDAHFGTAPPVAIGLIYGVALLTVTYALAALSYHAFEKHFLRLKRRFDSRPPTAEAAP